MRNKIKLFTNILFKKRNIKMPKLFSRIATNRFRLLKIVISIIFVFSISFVTFCTLAKNAGIAGTYYFYYEKELIETLCLNLTNDVTITKHKNTFCTKESVTKYKWNLTFHILTEKEIEYYKDKVTSSFILQICNDNWSSNFGFFYKDRRFYSQNSIPNIPLEQPVFVKK